MKHKNYYPFGSSMPGYSYKADSADGYRFGFNTQEVEPELDAGITSAEFWMYDSKLARRWNIDPRPKISNSSYCAFSNNPLLFSDIHGDTTFVYNTSAELVCTINDQLPNEIVFYNDAVASSIADGLSKETYSTEKEKQEYLNHVGEIMRNPFCHISSLDHDLWITYTTAFQGRITSSTISEMKTIANSSEAEGKEHALLLYTDIFGCLTGNGDCSDDNHGRLYSKDLGAGEEETVDIRAKLGPWNCSKLICGHTHPTTSTKGIGTIALMTPSSRTPGNLFATFGKPSDERDGWDFQTQAYTWVTDKSSIDRYTNIQSMMIIVTKFGFTLYRSDYSRDNEGVGYKAPDRKTDYYMYNRF